MLPRSFFSLMVAKECQSICKFTHKRYGNAFRNYFVTVKLYSKE